MLGALKASEPLERWESPKHPRSIATKNNPIEATRHFFEADRESLEPILTPQNPLRKSIYYSEVP